MHVFILSFDENILEKNFFTKNLIGINYNFAVLMDPKTTTFLYNKAYFFTEKACVWYVFITCYSSHLAWTPDPYAFPKLRLSVSYTECNAIYN